MSILFSKTVVIIVAGWHLAKSWQEEVFLSRDVE